SLNSALNRAAPPLGWRGVAEFVVPLPPLIRRGLWIALRRVLPLLLAPERCDVEVVPSASHLLVAATVNEVRAEHAIVVMDERVRAVPLVHAEVLVEVVRHRVPGNEPPAHPRLQAFDILLRPARDEHQGGVARGEMGRVSYLVSQHGAANAGVLGPAVYAGLEECAVNNQLVAAVEQIEQARFAVGAVELVLLFHRQPRHP